MPRPKPDPTLREVQLRIEAVRRAHKVRWTMSPHTAEMAIAAFVSTGREPVRPPTPKARRTKRHKRLL